MCLEYIYQVTSEQGRRYLIRYLAKASTGSNSFKSSFHLPWDDACTLDGMISCSGFVPVDVCRCIIVHNLRCRSWKARLAAHRSADTPL